MRTYPRTLQHPDGRFVNAMTPEAAERAIADGWYPPADCPEATPVPVELQCAPGCPNCVAFYDQGRAQREKFDIAYAAQKAELADVQEQLAEALRQVDALENPVKPKSHHKVVE